MTEQTIFDQATDQGDTQPQFTLPTEVADLVGAGKKYQSVEDALKSVPHAQSHIQKLEDEMKQMREELSKRKTAEELLDEIKSQGFPEKTSPATLDTDALSKVVENALSAREAQKKAAQNIDSVVNAFNEKFGEKGPEQYKLLAQESGLPLEYLNKLAATSPQAVMKLAGLESKQPTPGRTTSSINTTSMSSQPSTGSIKVKMVGSSTKELVSAWRAAGEAVKQELGIKE